MQNLNDMNTQALVLEGRKKKANESIAAFHRNDVHSFCALFDSVGMS